MMMAPYYALVVASVLIVIFSAFALRRVDRLPPACQPSTRKELGLIMVWGVVYFCLEVRWILLEYTNFLPQIDSYGWVASEFMVVIIFYKLIRREWSCASRPLGKMLVEKGHISDEVLCGVLREQDEEKKRIRLF